MHKCMTLLLLYTCMKNINIATESGKNHSCVFHMQVARTNLRNKQAQVMQLCSWRCLKGDKFWNVTVLSVVASIVQIMKNKKVTNKK